MTERLQKTFQRLIADYCRVSNNEVQNVSIIFAFNYTDEIYNKLMSIANKDDIDKTDEDKTGANWDCLFVCEFSLGIKNGLTIIFDSEELYYPTVVKRVII